MPLVTATCIKEVFDNGLVVGGKRIRDTRLYCKGEFIQNFDTDLAVLANQTTESGFWCFQWPGHDGKDPDYKERVRKSQEEAAMKARGIVATPPIQEAPKQKQTMSEDHKKKMADGRARRKAAKRAETVAA